ncbi:MAG: rod shape-determining protein MreC [Bacteroidales bacterium]
MRFLQRYHFTLLFILFEAFGITLLIQNNNYQNTSFVRFTRNIKGRFYDQTVRIEQYLSLKQDNKNLKEENHQLRNFIARNLNEASDTFKKKVDTAYDQQYYYIRATVLNNSINKQYNYLTLDKGRAAGIKPEMGVISSNGVVGVVRGVSENFSSVISLLNSELSISAKLKNSGYYGSFNWTGRDYRYGILQDIPLHVQVNPGDTVVTSGYSAIFPEGILVGFVEDYQEKGGRFLELTVELSSDFKKLNNVYIVRNLLKEEQEELENEFTIQ